MAFYWKGNSLFTCKGHIPAEIATSDTSFILDYRSTSSAVPNLMSICRFLSQSLTFVGLECIELWLDDWSVFSLKKKSAPTVDVPIPRDLETKTRQSMMRIANVVSQNAQIDASWMNIVGWAPTAVDKGLAQPSDPATKLNQGPSLRGFFSRLAASTQSAAAKKATKEEEATQQAIAEDIAGSSQATVFIRVNTVNIKSHVSSSFASELERATKKPPPKTTKIAILTSSYDETEASMSTLTGAASGKVAEVITSTLPNKSGRIFIGFPTAQTTGLLAHISAPSLIPTVERESIDLNARHVRTWNEELLIIAGISSRIAYSVEMASIRDKLTASSKANGGRIGEPELDAVLPATVHIFKQFNFRESTPLPRAGQIVEESFWSCDRKFSIDILSSRGVLPSQEVRIASESLSFVERIPVVPGKLQTQAVEFMTRLQELGLVSEITLADIKKELERQAISEGQLEEFMKWAVKKAKTDQVDTGTLQSLFAVTVTQLDQQEGETHGRLLALGDIKTFVNSHRIAPELPFPCHTMPFRFTKGINNPDLEAFGWEELQTVPWVRWLVESATSKQSSLPAHLNPTMHPPFAAQVLATISKGWESLSQSSKNSVVQVLAEETVIPTRLGLRKPGDAYFSSVRLFEDLPIISNLSGVKEKFLKALGVRKTIELSVIFERLMNDHKPGQCEQKASWSHVDLVRYLVSVWGDIPDKDLVQLRNTALCPAEKGDNRSEPTSQRFKLGDLFEPDDALRELGLPVLQWPGRYNAYAPECKFLRLLGLRLSPSASELLELMAKAKKRGDISVYEAGLRYFIQNYHQNKYNQFDLSGLQVAFLPVQDHEKGPLARPDDCFSEPQARVLGYQIVRNDLHPHASKLGVRLNPDITDCALRLIRSPPKDQTEAKALFGYFATRLLDINERISSRLGNATIVPTKPSGARSEKEQVPRYKLATPSSCFLGDGEEYGEIFDYVNFGKEANTFLLKIGSKHEPSTLELTRLLVREPARIFQTLGVEKYLSLLRQPQLNKTNLKKDKSLWLDMKRLPFLLAYHERPADPQKEKLKPIESLDAEDDDSDTTIREWHLRSADQIVIVDDLICYSLFKQHLVAAPQEEALEDLYFSLGSPTVSSQVREEPRLGPRKGDQRQAERLRNLIIERSRLFLHEQPSGSVLRDVKWLEKKLEVQEVQSASLRRTLQGYNLSNSEKRSAVLTESPNGKPLLSITSEYEVWQVSQEIVHLLIDRAKTQTVMVFEMFLTTSLYKLRARGYNVDRVLRRRAAEEARVAQLDRQRRQEEGRKMIEQSSQQQAPPTPSDEVESTPKQENGHLVVPGAFHNSPDRPSSTQDKDTAGQPPISKPKGLFSNLTRHLGIDDRSSSSSQTQQLQNFLGQNTTHAPQQTNEDPPPPPYTPHDPNANAIKTTRSPNKNNQTETVTSPARVQQNLTSAISASRSNNSRSLFSPPQTNSVKEVSSYCDSRPGQNLAFFTTSTPGLQIFLERTGSAAIDPATFVADNRVGIDSFAGLLLECGTIFGMNKGALHVFCDAGGPTIAFNSQGSIFANYRYFAQLHLSAFSGAGTTGAGHAPIQAGHGDAEGRAQALVYWFVVLCHELAHNIVGDHSSDHSFYTEQFVVQYFGRVAGRIFAVGSGGSGGGGIG